MKTNRKTRYGRVVGDQMDKTVVVAVETPRRHPLYKKKMKRFVKYKVHDESNGCKMGDVVRIEETRPLSRLKRWRVVEVITRGSVVSVQPGDIS